MTLPATEPLPARQAEYLRLGFETRGLEFKQSLDWGDREARLGLIRTFMAMSNTRDGGAVVVGVRENADGTYTPAGMSQEHFDSFVPDNIASQTARYADPPVEMRTIKGEHDGMLFVVVEVDAFPDVPTVCRQADGGGSRALREGAVYIRPAGTPRTEEIHTYRDMRDMIEQAVERRVERFRDLGLLPPTGVAQPAAGREALDREIEELL